MSSVVPLHGPSGRSTLAEIADFRLVCRAEATAPGHAGGRQRRSARLLLPPTLGQEGPPLLGPRQGGPRRRPLAQSATSQPPVRRAPDRVPVRRRRYGKVRMSFRRQNGSLPLYRRSRAVRRIHRLSQRGRRRPHELYVL